MQIKNTNTFLKITICTLAFGVLAFGFLTNSKNFESEKINSSLNEASIVIDNTVTIPEALGNCQQIKNIGTSSMSEQSLFVIADNLDTILSGDISFDTTAMNILTTAIVENRIETKILESNKKYEFVVKDEQLDFWKCVLQENQLFTSVLEDRETEFFSDTAIFSAQIENFGYAVAEIRIVEQFLNFAKLPAGHQISESTILNSEGAVFFKIFEVELVENFSYNDLRKDLRNRVGITNLRPAVFGADSFYWMWGEKNRMAASVFPIGEKVFGVSYQTAHFRHVRRVIDYLR